MRRFVKELDNKAWLLIIIGTTTWALTMIKSGIVYEFGMGFWGPNGHDGVWHIAVAESLSKGSFEMPVFAQEVIKNYHVGFDLFLAILGRITFIPLVNLYFQILPVLFALLTGIFVYKFVYLWKHSREAAFWSTFFIYFGGSFGWIVKLLQSRIIGGESMFWAQQSISTLVNPPFAMSLVLLFAGLYLLVDGLRKRNKKTLTLVAFLFGFLIQIKVYAGLLVLGGLVMAGIFQIRIRDFRILRVFAGALVLSLLLFLPLNKESQNNIVFQPFWFLESMLLLPDRFGWIKLGEATVNYRLGGVWHKATLAYLLSFFIFWYGNIGSRLVGQFYIAKKILKRKIDSIDIFIFSVIVAGAILPMLYVQKGTPWNTIQFFYYSMVFLSILSGIVVADWMSKKRIKMVLTIAIVVITVPTTIGTLTNHYLPQRPPAKISNEELHALKFLREQPEGDVLTIPFDRDAAIAAADNPPRPLYLYESTAYVSAFSGKQVYLEDEVNLEITGYEWRARREEVIRELENKRIREFVERNNIRYVYLTKPNTLEVDFEGVGVEKVFENSEVIIYRI